VIYSSSCSMIPRTCASQVLLQMCHSPPAASAQAPCRRTQEPPAANSLKHYFDSTHVSSRHHCNMDSRPFQSDIDACEGKAPLHQRLLVQERIQPNCFESVIQVGNEAPHHVRPTLVQEHIDGFGHSVAHLSLLMSSTLV
jgi:hypothetical protein